MKIEKVSEKQIRCTLNREDLIDRELRISELAYGTEKAKALFRDMMQQANYEFGFEAEDIPLMIEAIPVSPECLILLITKVDDPDELDTRFSKFSSSTDDDYDDNYDDDDDDDDNSYADEIINCFEQISDLLDDTISDNKNDLVPISDDNSEIDKDNAETEVKETKSVSIPSNLIKIYTFHSLDEVIQLSKIIHNFYDGENSVYKNPLTSVYYLVLTKSEHTPEDYNKICNIISEYGHLERSTYASQFYYQEHFEVIVKDRAVQILSTL